jgi:hypothetical protein
MTRRAAAVAVLLAILLTGCGGDAGPDFCSAIDEAVEGIRALPTDDTRLDDEMEAMHEQLEEGAAEFHGEQEQDAERVIDEFFLLWEGEPFTLEDDFNRDLFLLLADQSFIPTARDYQAEWCE